MSVAINNSSNNSNNNNNSTNNTTINATTAEYCYIDFDINHHRAKLGLVASFVQSNNSRYGFTSKDLRKLGGSELKRLVDDKLIENDIEWKEKIKKVTTATAAAIATATANTAAVHTANTTTIDEVYVRPPKAGNRIIIQLFWDKCPKTCENFATLCYHGGTSSSASACTAGQTRSKAPIGECGKPLTYCNSIVHRIVSGFIIQCGDFVFGNGSGGESIYNNGKKFKDEKPGLQMKHNRRGIVSMGNSGKNSNSSQFFITFTNVQNQCDGKHVIFGTVISGWEVLDALEQVGSCTGSQDEKPIVPVIITDCGIYQPFRTPGAGYWYDQPDDGDNVTFYGYTPTFIVRPRVAVIGPNEAVLIKFQELLINHCSLKLVTIETDYSTSITIVEQNCDTTTTTINNNNHNKSNNIDVVVRKYIANLLNSFSIDIVLVAPACSKLLLPPQQQEVGVCDNDHNDDTVPSKFMRAADVVKLYTSSIVIPDDTKLIGIPYNQIVMESKPVDALHAVHTKSWIAKTVSKTQWQLDGK